MKLIFHQWSSFNKTHRLWTRTQVFKNCQQKVKTAFFIKNQGKSDGVEIQVRRLALFSHSASFGGDFMKPKKKNIFRNDYFALSILCYAGFYSFLNDENLPNGSHSKKNLICSIFTLKSHLKGYGSLNVNIFNSKNCLIFKVILKQPQFCQFLSLRKL